MRPVRVLLLANIFGEVIAVSPRMPPSIGVELHEQGWRIWRALE